MLKLPKPIITFKGKDCMDFLKRHDNGMDLLPNLFENRVVVPKDITRFQVNSFKKTFQEISWLFIMVTCQENIAIISRMIIYILYFIVKEKSIFDWGKIIYI
jgi:hypothetical protein